jgi:hypothetical protein
MLTKALQFAAHITHPVTAAIFAAVLALIALIALSKGRKKTPPIAWVLALAILLLGVSPLLASTYLDSRGVYRVRMEVLGPDNQPVRDAAVTSSAGGEMKKTDAGWEFTIPPQDKPADGAVTFRASAPDAFLSGSVKLKLAHDYFPEIVLQLSPLPAGTLRGMVADDRGRPIEGARVWLLGYEDAASTSPTGSFSLPAHSPDGMQVTVLARKGDATAQISAYVGKSTEIILRRH